MNSIVIALTVNEPAKLLNTKDNYTLTRIGVKSGDVPLRLEAWGEKLATRLSALAIGTHIMVTGELHVYEEDSPTGKQYYNTIKISNFEVLPTLVSINQVALIGRVTANPQLKYFESGSCKITPRIAVERVGKKDETDFINLEIWNKTAMVAADYAKSGQQIGITGQLKFESWVDKNTNVLRHKLLVNVDRMDLLASPKKTEVAV